MNADLNRKEKWPEFFRPGAEKKTSVPKGDAYLAGQG